MNRTAGILLSVSSLPGRFGIGCFSKSAYDFVDWLKEAGADLLADSAAGAHQLRGFAVPVLFHLCGKSVFYQSG